MRKSAAATAGGVAAAFLSSLCCIGPLLVVSFGVGAGLVTTIEPLRPWFGVAMLIMFALGFFAVYAPRRESGPVEAGAAASCKRRGDRLDAVVLWLGVAIGVALWTFPTWSVWLL